jgi:hypothetical protein
METSASPTNISSDPTSSSAEDELRKQLRAALQSLNRREPLDTTYKRLLLNGTVTRRCPVLPKDKFYKRVGSNIRQRVEAYMVEMAGKDPFDRISQRLPLEEDKMRAAFTLREPKTHEQQPLLEATLAQSLLDPERKRHLDGIALGLQSRAPAPKKVKPSAADGSTSDANAIKATEQARRTAELDRQRAQARKWEEARSRREAEEKQRREQELLEQRAYARGGDSTNPQQALMEKVFQNLWDMNFVVLGNTNPFRIVIDRDNCASIGAPDYFDVITIPMNLTYIKSKVLTGQYSTLQTFFADVDLMIQNALKYNSDPGNPYAIAAEEMRKRYTKIAKRVWQQIRQRQQSQQASNT